LAEALLEPDQFALFLPVDRARPRAMPWPAIPRLHGLNGLHNYEFRQTTMVAVVIEFQAESRYLPGGNAGISSVPPIARNSTKRKESA
jgi:hypothetical protein